MNLEYKLEKYKHKFNKIRQLNTLVPNYYPLKTNIYDAINSFSVNLTNSLDTAENLISPLSIAILLSVVNLAALSSTSNQITNIIGYKIDYNQLSTLNIKFNNDTIQMINIIITNDNHINRDYVDMVKPFAKIYYMDKDTERNVNQINKYISRFTNDLIKNAITDTILTNTTSLSLINVTTFRGSWLYPFDITNTFSHTFHHSETTVEMMSQINYFNYFEDANIKLIELPYYEQEYSFGIILPKKYLEEDNLEYGINDIPTIPIDEINEFINNMEYTCVNVAVPKFTINKCYQLDNILKKIGIDNIFKPNAELNMISDDASVNNIIHIITLEISEVGYINYSKPKSTIKKTSQLASHTFNADHSFTYYIRHTQLNMFLVMGEFIG